MDHRDNYSLEEGNYRWECVSVPPLLSDLLLAWSAVLVSAVSVSVSVSVCCVSVPPLLSDLLLPWSAGKEQGRPWGAAWMAPRAG